MANVVTPKTAEAGRTGKTTAVALATLLVLAAVVGGVIWGAWQILIGLPAQLGPAVVTAFVTAIVAILSVNGTKLWDRRLAIEQELRKQKLPVYEDFLQRFFRSTVGSKFPDMAAEPDALPRLYVDFMPKLVLWGSDDVVKEFIKFRSSGSNVQEDKIRILFAFEELMYKMRSDLGHKNKGLSKGMLLSIFVNDLEEVDRLASMDSSSQAKRALSSKGE